MFLSAQFAYSFRGKERVKLLLTRKEITIMLIAVRKHLHDLQMGLHRYWLLRKNKSLTEQELLPVMKEEISMWTRIRNKLWRMKRDAPPEDTISKTK